MRESIEKSKADLADTSFEIMDAWHTLAERFANENDWCPFSQVLAVIGADLGVYPCQDKAYNHEALLGSLSNQSFKEFWMNGKEAFFRLRPGRDCRHHCVAAGKNRMLLDYLAVDEAHGAFV